MDFNQLLKLAEQKKSEPIELATKKVASEPEPERPMTKKQKREYEEEMARRQRKQMRLEAEKSGGRKVSHGTGKKTCAEHILCISNHDNSEREY